MASLEPSFVITNSKTKISPTFGVALPDDSPFAILKSACAGMIVMVSSSSSSPLPSPSSSTVSSVVGSLSGSYWSLAVIWAEFVYSPAAPVGALTVAS